MGSCSPVTNVRVSDLVYELIGEVSLDSEGSDGELEQYLTNSNCNVSDPQGMARTKQTAQKNKNNPPQPQLSSGSFQIAVGNPRRSPRFEGESSQDSVGSSMPSPRRSPRKEGSTENRVYVNRGRQQRCLITIEERQEGNRKSRSSHCW